MPFREPRGSRFFLPGKGQKIDSVGVYRKSALRDRNRVAKDLPRLRSCSPVAQLVEQRTVNPLVAGSSPARGAIAANSTQLRRKTVWPDIGCRVEQRTHDTKPCERLPQAPRALGDAARTGQTSIRHATSPRLLAFPV